MAVTITQKQSIRGHSKALPRIDLNQPGRLRVGHLMTYYSLSHSSIYTHLRKKLLPPPDGVVASRPYWRTETIKADLENGMHGAYPWTSQDGCGGVHDPRTDESEG